MVCWKCRESVQGPVCVSCRSIQPLLAGQDHFSLLSQPRSYFLETGDIERSYRAVSRKVHPDRFAARSAVERRMSLQWTASVNEARRVLMDPLRRALFLATGRSEPEETGGPVMSPEFLEEVFELQMSREEDPEGVAAKTSEALRERMQRLTSLFSAWEGGNGGIEGAEAVLAEVRYLERITRSAN